MQKQEHEDIQQGRRLGLEIVDNKVIIPLNKKVFEGKVYFSSFKYIKFVKEKI